MFGEEKSRVITDRFDRNSYFPTKDNSIHCLLTPIAIDIATKSS